MTTMTLGQWLHQYLAQARRKWEKQDAGVQEGHDPEAIHQMRVAMRRLRAAMSGFGNVLDLPQATRKVGMISRVLGQARDADVMLMRLEEHYLPALPPSEQKILQSLIHDLRQHRREMQRELVALLTSTPYRRVKEAWDKWLTKPRWRAVGDWPVAMALPHFLGMAWGELALHPGWRVVTVDENPELLHDLRKAIKSTRYQWECAQDELPAELTQVLVQLRQAQDILGNLQDGFVLTSRLGKRCPTLDQLLTSEEHQTWQTWQTLRQSLQTGTTHARIYHALGQQCLNLSSLPPNPETAHHSEVPLG